jgi:hypothetical protein
MSGFLFAPLKLVSVSACQRHHSGSTKDVVSNNAFQGVFSRKPSASEAGRGKVIVKPLQHSKASFLAAQE